MKTTFTAAQSDRMRAVNLSDVRADEALPGTSLTRAASYSWSEALAFYLVEVLLSSGAAHVTVTVLG